MLAIMASIAGAAAASCSGRPAAVILSPVPSMTKAATMPLP